MSESTKLAEMLCTRFCHDIIGPVGAVSNGAEFLREEMKGVQSQAADLIESSSKEAVARVQYYRQAYGIGSVGISASLTDTKQLTADYLSFGKVKLDWSDKYTDMSGVEINHTHKKVIMNLIILAAGSLIKGGTVEFTVTPEVATITAKGDIVKFDEKYETCLKGNINEDSVEPRLVQAFYTRKLAEGAGKEIGLVKDTNSLTLTMKI